MLERESGPSGSLVIGDQRFEIDGWELFEGDSDSPHMCRGWFRYREPELPVKRGTVVRLELDVEEGGTRELTATLEKARTTTPEWEFRAQR